MVQRRCSWYPQRVIPTIPLSRPLRLILLYAPVPSPHLVPLASLPDVVRTFVTVPPARHLPKPWLSLALSHGQLPTWGSWLMSLPPSVPSHSTIKSEGMSFPSVMTLQMPRMMSCLCLLAHTNSHTTQVTLGRVQSGTCLSTSFILRLTAARRFTFF